MRYLRNVAVPAIAAVTLAVCLPAAAAEAPADAAPPASPASWLPVEGKDEAWVKATARCRELLGQLKADDAKLARWLPAVKARCETIARLKAIGGFEREAIVSMTEAMLEDLTGGKPPLVRYAGKTVPLGYWSDRKGGLTGVKLFVPPDYDPSKEYQVFMYYKMGGGLYWMKGDKFVSAGSEGAEFSKPWRPTEEMCRTAPNTFHIWSSLYYGLKGRMSMDAELTESTAALCRDFAVSDERIFLTGFSDGGFTSWWLGSYYPHVVAGIAPEVGNWQYRNDAHVGLFNVATLVVDGWSDGGFIQENICRWHVLRNAGYDIAGLIGQHGHATVPYENAEEFKRIMDWAATKRLNRWPKRVRYATWNLTWHRGFWASIERMVEPALAADIDLAIKDGNRIEGTTHNVGAVKLLLDRPDKLGLDKDKPLTVVVNGKEVYSGKIDAEVIVNITPAPAGRFVKGPITPGDVSAAMTEHSYDTKGFLAVAGQRWSTVRPTGGDEAARKVYLAACPESAVDDEKALEADSDIIRDRHLFVIGGPEVNKLTAKIAADLPVKFGKGRFTIGNKVYDKPGQCVRFIHPNPLNPRRYVMIFACNDPVAAKAAGFGGMGEGFFKTTAWSFREGDGQVYGVADPKREYGIPFASQHQADWLIFGSDWGPPDQTVLGQATAPFDSTAIQRLKADAIKEATGADAAIVAAYPPSWNQWKNWIPAGPVTMLDLAVTEMFPQYAVTCKVTGAQLKSFVGQSLCSTVVRSKDDPYYAEGKLLLSEIDDAKTYTLASDYSACDDGLLGYGVDPPKMPALFYFETPEQFNASGSARLLCRDLRQTDVQVTAAVAEYVRKRGKIAPRPVGHSLVHFVVSPEVNTYGPYDWAWIKLPASFTDPRTGKPVERADSIAVGLKRKGEPDNLAPRANSKTLATWADGKPDGPLSIDLAGLDKKLPVKIDGQRKAFALMQENDRFKLSTAPAASENSPARKGGVAILMTLTIANAGDVPLEGLLMLASPTVRAFYDATWPPGKDKAEGIYYGGFMDDVGPSGAALRGVKTHADATLILTKSGRPAFSSVMLPGAGYGKGTIAVTQPIAIEPGKTLTIPVLVIGIDAADAKGDKPVLPDLNKVLADLREELTKS